MHGEKAQNKGGMIIAIDGPAGAGKSTVARDLARAMRLRYLDTGAMYRSLTLKALRDHIPLDDEEGLAEMASRTDLRMLQEDGNPPAYRMIMDGEDVNASIRSREVSTHVSQVSSHPGLRREMVRKQREIAEGGGIIVEGRDVGTVVFPAATFKFFITASVKERARRRFEEIKEDGYEVAQNTIEQEMIKRDHQDYTREINPLKRAPDAVLVDTTGKSVSRIVEELLEFMRRREGAGEER